MSSAHPTLGPVVFTRFGVLRGMRTALPLVLGTFPFGLVVGMISDQKGLSLLETWLMAALLFAGSAQLLALELWSEPAPIMAATAAALVVNIRMAPMGAALAPWLDRLSGLRLWGSLAFMVDHAFALSAADQRRGGRDAGFLFGLGMTLWCFWTVSVTAGHILGSNVGLPAGHPFYFAATATFLAILVPLWQNLRRDFWPWLVSGALAVLTWRLGLGAPGPLLVGAFAGASLGAWLELNKK